MKEFDPGDAPSIVSMTDRVRPVEIGAPVTAVHFLGENAAFVGAEENVFLVSGQSEVTPRCEPAHSRNSGFAAMLGNHSVTPL